MTLDEAEVAGHRNNFDLIRLAAATQVTIVHVAEHLNIRGGVILDLIKYFPGVPIFFFVSGFLVSTSLERSPGTAVNARKRLLRIYPVLWSASPSRSPLPRASRAALVRARFRCVGRGTDDGGSVQ